METHPSHVQRSQGSSPLGLGQRVLPAAAGASAPAVTPSGPRRTGAALPGQEGKLRFGETWLPRGTQPFREEPGERPQRGWGLRGAGGEPEGRTALAALRSGGGAGASGISGPHPLRRSAPSPPTRLSRCGRPAPRLGSPRAGAGATPPLLPESFPPLLPRAGAICPRPRGLPSDSSQDAPGSAVWARPGRVLRPLRSAPLSPHQPRGAAPPLSSPHRRPPGTEAPPTPASGRPSRRGSLSRTVRAAPRVRGRLCPERPGPTCSRRVAATPGPRGAAGGRAGEERAAPAPGGGHWLPRARAGNHRRRPGRRSRRESGASAGWGRARGPGSPAGWRPRPRSTARPGDSLEQGRRGRRRRARGRGLCLQVLKVGPGAVGGRTRAPAPTARRPAGRGPMALDGATGASMLPGGAG